jgi:asparagine synthase (glutamine-hydrolysing)
MCGLAGFVGPGDRSHLQAMADRLAHRGPDGEGFFVDQTERVFLGHRRLAILDVEGGSQPMWNETDQVGIIYNGEIYNHMELRRTLQARGHVFRTSHSDTEVLVHGYEEWGTSLPERLNGMFAFAIYDRGRRQLFLARDRFGEKPLYYLHKPRAFLFASELTALACHPDFDRSVDPRALQKLFAYGYLPAPLALYTGSRKLPGGCWLRYDLASDAIECKRYWRFQLEPDEALGDAAEPALVEELTSLLSQAVERRLISDVPLGVFLSGGIDSSSVLAMAARHRPPSSLKTFTVGFVEPSFDESPFAAEVADAFGTDHQVRQLDLDGVTELIPRVLGALDEPSADASIVPTYLLSAFTREQVTVALSGDGGDELFAGYDPFAALAPARIYSRLVPQGLHRRLRRLADVLPVSTLNMSWDFKIRRALAGMSYPPSMWNPVWMAPLDPRDMREIFEQPVAPEELYEEAITLWESDRRKSTVDRTLEFFTNFYLQDDILAKVDRAAMMSSLESRAVFLDNDLVEFCRRLPTRFKIRNGQRKYLLKKAMQRLLPPTILARRKKGFGIPMVKWLRSLPAPPLSVPGMRTQALAARWTAHRSGTADHRLLLWTSLSLAYSLNARSSPRSASPQPGCSLEPTTGGNELSGGLAGRHRSAESSRDAVGNVLDLR